MKQKLLNISNNIEPSSLETLTLVTTVANELDIETLVIGATAIDIIFDKIHSIKIHRATNDIDFSVRVKNWNDYSRLIQKLKTQGFSETSIEHRFNYKSIPSIDLIPFGSISIPDTKIKWGGKEPKEMSVLGYEECYNDGIVVRISTSPDIDIRTSSPKGLVMMKLISWKDAFPSRERDAIDIFYIMYNYIDAGNQDRLHDDHYDLLEEDFDYELTGATLLGRDIASIAKPLTLQYIISLISEEINHSVESNLIKDMAKSDFSNFDYDKKLNHCKKLVQNFLQGLQTTK